jgi:hypothetical protein
MFLPANVVAAANRHVHNSTPDKLPSFRRNFAGEVTVRGSLLRYSTTTPPAGAK